MSGGVRTGHSLWRRHPALADPGALTRGERAADVLKKYFGTWSALFAVGAWIVVWVVLQRTGARWDPYPYILLNLCLSCLAAVQGIILQISANRGDRLSAVVALHTQDNTDRLRETSDVILDLQRQQMEILETVEAVAADVAEVRRAVTRA
jgi:uncharacterized membrane protein